MGSARPVPICQESIPGGKPAAAVKQLPAWVAHAGTYSVVAPILALVLSSVIRVLSSGHIWNVSAILLVFSILSGGVAGLLAMLYFVLYRRGVVKGLLGLLGLSINLYLTMVLILPAYQRALDRYHVIKKQKESQTPLAPGQAVGATSTLAGARRGFTTRIMTTGEREPPAPAPPAGVFKLIRYDSSVGKLAAYITPEPGEGAKHPAIVWITGGDCNSIGEMWAAMPRSNDQSAAAYRKTDIVTMFPSLRGGNDNPGRREGFYGEVDDVIAAADYLADLPYVDTNRIYLGGHSTGGTLAMLVAETCTRFRAVFAFGAVTDVREYGGQFVYHDPSNPREAELRSPGRWLDSVRSPLFVIEGSGGNIAHLKTMQTSNRNPMIRFLAVRKKDHFSILAPGNELIASKILADTGTNMGITLTDADADAIGRR